MNKPKEAQGFTLIEILMAMFIFTIVVSTLYLSYTGTLRNMEAVESQADIYGMARMALERMIDDLESAYVPPWIQDSKSQADSDLTTDFRGEDAEIQGRHADTLRFQSKAHLAFGEKDEDNRATEIAYTLKEKDEGGGFTLYRSDTSPLHLRTEEALDGWVLCDDVYSINFIYHDENGEVYDHWDSSKAEFHGRLPTMVSIELLLLDRSNPESYFRFKTDVSLPIVGGGGWKGAKVSG